MVWCSADPAAVHADRTEGRPRGCASPELTEQGPIVYLQGDDDLMTVCIGEIFLEFVNMLPAFQTYCLQQSSSVNMLNALEKEKELLR